MSAFDGPREPARRSWQRIALDVGRFLLPYLGSLSGPVVLTAATVALYSLFQPEALRDGQFWMIYLVTVPFGLLLGGVVGVSARLLCARERRAAGLCAGISGLVVMLLSIIVLLLGVSPFGFMEVLLVIATAGGLSIMGTWIVGSTIRAKSWARFRRPRRQQCD